MNEPTREDFNLMILDVQRAQDGTVDVAQTIKSDRSLVRPAFRAVFDREPISLTYTEYRLLELLASRPYRAFSPRRIAEAISSEAFPVSESTLRRHVTSLREKLGFFADYIQTVPHMGYRFKP